MTQGTWTLCSDFHSLFTKLHTIVTSVLKSCTCMHFLMVVSVQLCSVWHSEEKKLTHGSIILFWYNTSQLPLTKTKMSRLRPEMLSQVDYWQSEKQQQHKQNGRVHYRIWHWSQTLNILHQKWIKLFHKITIYSCI